MLLAFYRYLLVPRALPGAARGRIAGLGRDFADIFLLLLMHVVRSC